MSVIQELESFRNDGQTFLHQSIMNISELSIPIQVFTYPLTPLMRVYNEPKVILHSGETSWLISIVTWRGARK